MPDLQVSLASEPKSRASKAAAIASSPSNPPIRLTSAMMHSPSHWWAIHSLPCMVMLNGSWWGRCPVFEEALTNGRVKNVPASLNNFDRPANSNKNQIVARYEKIEISSIYAF